MPKTASQAEIKKAYYTLAKKYHPDTNKDKASQEKFLKIQEAYEVSLPTLSPVDTTSRRQSHLQTFRFSLMSKSVNNMTHLGRPRLMALRHRALAVSEPAPMAFPMASSLMLAICLVSSLGPHSRRGMLVLEALRMIVRKVHPTRQRFRSSSWMQSAARKRKSRIRRLHRVRFAMDMVQRTRRLQTSVLAVAVLVRSFLRSSKVSTWHERAQNVVALVSIFP